MNYYIADPHFGHQNIISLCHRPFDSVENMNEIMINNWNKRIKDSDDVYIIGDLFFRINNVEDILNRLKGRKHLIVGNHDYAWLNDSNRQSFVSINDYLEIHDCNHRIVLSHYPMLAYHRQSKAYMIHGHIHNDTLFDYWHVLVKRERILNAGVDINHFMPVTFNELLKNNQRYKTDMLESYPCHLLSVRFNIDYLSQHNIDKTKLYQTLEKSFNLHQISLIKEGLYLIEDYQSNITYINELKIAIDNTDFRLIFKNFDIVEVFEDGSFKVHK